MAVALLSKCGFCAPNRLEETIGGGSLNSRGTAPGRTMRRGVLITARKAVLYAIIRSVLYSIVYQRINTNIYL
jgi:hypothetical protein